MKKQSSGYYRTKIVIGHDEHGKPVNKWISAPTKRELESRRQEVIDRYINGDRSMERILFGEYARQWYTVRKLPHISEGSAQLYSCTLNRHILPRFKDVPLHSIKTMDVQSFINGLSGYSADTIKTIRMLLHSIMESAVHDGYIPSNPVNRIRIDGKPQKDKYLLTPADRAAIEHVCRAHEDRLLLALLYYTGMRDGEMLALTWSDIHLSDRTITVRGSVKRTGGSVHIGSTKTKSSVRTIPIPAPLADILTSVPAGFPDQLIIHNKNNGNPIPACQFYARWSRLMEACGIGHPCDKPKRRIYWESPITAHTLRHNYATMLYEHGVDPYTASRLLGHSSVKTTLEIYTHMSTQALTVARHALDDIFSHSQEVAK